MSFANIEYLPVIAFFSAAAIAAFAGYLYWKRLLYKRGDIPLPSSMIIISRKAEITKNTIIFTSIIIAAIILLKPQWGETETVTRQEGTDILIALDVSLSMLADDARPSRLERAKQAVRYTVMPLTGDRAGLLLFAGESFVQCPFTSDIGAFLHFLDSASPASAGVMGTDIGGALKTAEEVFRKKRPVTRKLLLITDGEDHEGKVREALTGLKELEVKVYTAGIGTEEGGYIPLPSPGGGEPNYYRKGEGQPIVTRKNIDLLKMISSETGGYYTDITTGFSGLRKLKSDMEAAEKTRSDEKKATLPIDRTPLFAALLSLLLVLELVIPSRRAAEK